MGRLGLLLELSPSTMHPVNVYMFVCLSVLVISFCEASVKQQEEDCLGTWMNGKCNEPSRRRRSCTKWVNGECMDGDRKRRSTCDGEWVNGECKDGDRKRRSTCDGVWVNGVCKDGDRKRRSTPEDELCVIDEDHGDSDDVC